MNDGMPICGGDNHRFTPLPYTLGGVLKEIQRRCELRPRLEAEMGRSLTDEEFLVIAERTGGRV
ncbi:MAG: hypothetical protein JSR29_01545 [Nitrospira sp.]|nr:hypothetical protein [Nitrospira sp.]